MKIPELLAPAGNFEKLKTAFHFGADAVYLAGKRYGLRAFADNFSDEEIKEAAEFAHSLGKKVYVTLNIFAVNADFDSLAEYLKVLEHAEVDAVLVSDPGIFDFVRSNSRLAIHISTQANTTNAFAVSFWHGLGAERVVLARELPLADIAEIHRRCPDVQLEAFVHGAMCISYSGRCLMSNYLVNRDSNRGECVQACRWKWAVREISRNDSLPVEEDERGTYIFNSKDMNMLAHLTELIDAGICSLKIEGRMKSPFYVATVVNAYRRALDAIAKGKFDGALISELEAELNKASHRDYTTGFYFDENESRQYYEDSRAKEEYKFIAVVKGEAAAKPCASCKAAGAETDCYAEAAAVQLAAQENSIAEKELFCYEVEQRNKFSAGDSLEVLSAGSDNGKSFVVSAISDVETGASVTVANHVQQRLIIRCPYLLQTGDILRKKL